MVLAGTLCYERNMPYLAWKKGGDELRLSEHPRLGSQLLIRLSASEREDLLREFGALLDSSSRELRIDASSGCTVFFKTRESESRALLAHPERENWVATLAFEPADLRRLVSELQRPTGTVSLSQLMTLGGLSNLELVLEL